MTRHWRHTPCGVLQLRCKPGSKFSCWLPILFLPVSSSGPFSWELCCAWYGVGRPGQFSNFTPRYVGVSCWWISSPLICRMNSSLLGNKEKQVASVLVLFIITNHSFAQSEMRFIASCILMVVMVTCSALVHNARSSACSACCLCEDSCLQRTDVISENNEENWWDDSTLWDSSAFHWRADLSVKPDSIWSLEQVATGDE